jgi:PAS domain-containing protein
MTGPGAVAAARETHPVERGRRSNPFSSLTLAAAALVFVVTAAAMFGLGQIAASGDRQDALVSLLAETERVFRAAIDPRFKARAEEIERVLDRLLVIEAIAGGAIFDRAGHRLQVFGERPYTSFEQFRSNAPVIFTVDHPRRVEFHLGPEVTGTPFHLLVRVDSSAVDTLTAERRWRRFAVALGAATAAAVFTGLFVGLAIAGPLRRIAKAVEDLAANPRTPDTGPPLPAGRSELGRLSAGVQRLRDMLSDIWRTKVAVSDAVLERSPFGIVQTAADGTPLSANPAAVDLFQREIVRGPASGLLTVEDVASGHELPLRDHLARQRGGGRLVRICGTNPPRYAVVAGLTVGADTRTPTIVALFADVTETQVARLDAEERFAGGAALLRNARRREAEFKLMLESCLTLLGGPDRQPDEHLDPLPFAAEWLAGAREAGLVIKGQVLNAEGPTVVAPPDDMRAVLRLALLVAYARVGSAPVDLVIDARGLGFESAGVTVRASPAAGVTAEPVVADWQLAFAALRTAVRRANGQLTEFAAGEEGTVLKFTLRAAARAAKATAR